MGKNFQECETQELFGILVEYIGKKWYASPTFLDDIDEPKCILALQELAKRLGIDFTKWLDIIHTYKPNWVKENIALSEILKDIRF